MCESIVKHCVFCGNEISKSLISKSCGKATFCSRSCYDKSRTAHWKSIAVPCKNCGKISDDNPVSARTKRLFCSIACRNEFKMPPPVNCRVCGVFFSAIKWRKEGGYARDKTKKNCSRECLSEFMRSDQDRKDKIGLAISGENHHAWVGGSSRLTFRGHNWRSIAEGARERAGRKCEHCGLPEHQHCRKLDVHHKIPFNQMRNKTRANSPDNLEALCKSCHAKADKKWRNENQVQIVMNMFLD